MNRFSPIACALVGLGCQYLSNVNELEIVESSHAPTAWGCLTAPSQSAPVPVVKYSGQVSLVPSNEPVKDVTLRLCRNDDDACAEPVLAPVHSADGNVEFEVAGTFNGYIQLESPNALPTVIEIWRPLGSMRVRPDLKMVRADTMALFAKAMQVSIDPDMGHTMFWVEDCTGERAAGALVRVIENEQRPVAKLPPNTIGYYSVDGRLPSISVGMTDATGGGGIINLPATFWTFEGSLAAEQQHISTFAARVRPGTLTVFVVEPG